MLRGIHLGQRLTTSTGTTGRVTFTVLDDVVYLTDRATAFVFEAPVTFVGPTTIPSGLITAETDTLFFHYDGGTWSSPATQVEGTTPVGGRILNDVFYVTIANVTYAMPVTATEGIPGMPPGGDTSLVTIDDVEYLRIVFPDGEVRYEEVHETPTPDAEGGGGGGGGVTADGTNTWAGTDVGASNTTGVQNSGFGFHALDNNTLGNYNTGFGVNALGSNLNASNNTGFGVGALGSNTAGGCNTAIGTNALALNKNDFTDGREDDGDSNTAVGYNAMVFNKTGASNVAIGASAMEGNGAPEDPENPFPPNSINDGNENVAIGQHALNKNDLGSFNTGVGGYTIQDNANGLNNTALGYAALQHTTGGFNTALGANAGRTNVTGIKNVFIGNGAGYYETGSSKLIIDNSERTSEAVARTDALVYGIFGNSPADQSLTVNGRLLVPDDPYDPTAWNGNLSVPTKNAIRDALTSLPSGGVALGDSPVWTGTHSFVNPIGLGSPADVFLARLAARNFRLGAAPSSAPQAQTFTIGEASRPGTDVDVAGANGTIQSGLGTGAATPSTLLFQTPLAVASGSATQTYATRMQVDSSGISVANVAAGFIWSTRSKMLSSGDSVIELYNNAGNNFNLLRFGGTTSAFPAFKRNGATINCRLADDSGNAGLTVANLTAVVGTFSGAISATGITGTGAVIAGTAQPFKWTSKSEMSSPTDGIIEFTNNAGTDFSRLQLGGTTASFPAIKRNTTGIQFVVADDSGPTWISAQYISTNDTYLQRGNVSLTNGAAAATATMTNAPVAGNPTKWVPIYDNGTTRYIPAW